MFRNILFQAHWLVGITAGLVLAVVGVTGALLSFEDPILHRLNADVREVTPLAEQPLAPPQLLRRIAANYPQRQITALSVSGDPRLAARVTFARESQPGAQQGGGRGRGETRYVNPYTGAVMSGEGARGAGFFRTSMTIHRWLTAGEIGNREVGKHIVGASTLLLVLMAITGIYLRWPARGQHSWRSWFGLDFKLKGRSFLWSLHSIAGTWLLIAYLCMALTGLHWSYNWYRSGLYALAGVERPAGGGSDDRGGGRSEPLDLTATWASFIRARRGAPFETANINLSRGSTVEIRYLDADPQHEREFSSISIEARTGEIRKHELYADKKPGAKLIASIFPLHSGSFFGLPGVVIFALASLAMPLFAVTGWMLYLDRRERKARARARAAQATPAVPSSVPTARSGSG